jgi:thioredoxin-related protein
LGVVGVAKNWLAAPERAESEAAMKFISIFFAVVMIAIAGPTAGDAARGKVKGGVAYSLPQWFKHSLLDFREDIQEARKQGKHVMVFLHFDECPYCARMVKENFVSGASREFVETNFDVIGIDVLGSLEVIWIDGATYTEKALAAQLKAFATPTIVFLDQDGTKVLQLTGYRDSRALRYALEYVQSKSYRSESFTAYVAARDKPAIYTFRKHPQFSNATYFKGYTMPLAILFEDRYCAECARFHDKTLNHPDVLVEMRKFLFVRLDAESNRPIIDPTGKTTTPAQWAKTMDLSYRPAVVLFNEGREIYRVDGRLYHFHFKEALRYVSGGYYNQFDSVSKYRAAYREELLKKGIDINFAE